MSDYYSGWRENQEKYSKRFNEDVEPLRAEIAKLKAELTAAKRAVGRLKELAVENERRKQERTHLRSLLTAWCAAYEDGSVTVDEYGRVTAETIIDGCQDLYENSNEALAMESKQ
jgi:multidrug resistance efflux pump